MTTNEETEFGNIPDQVVQVDNTLGDILAILDEREFTRVQACTLATGLFVQINEICGKNLMEAVDELKEHIHLWEDMKKTIDDDHTESEVASEPESSAT